MLEELELRDLGPIRKAVIAPAAGMTAITGETGAGKSMLLSALQLISGGGADSARVSPEADKAWAQGVFSVGEGHPVLQAAQDCGVEAEDGELFLSRTVPASGRSRAVCGGKTVPRSVLSRLAEYLVTIHGQSDQIRIASPARQRAFLDDYARNTDERAAYAIAWQDYREVSDRLERLSAQQAQVRQQADYLKDSIAQINRVDPQPDELDTLKAQRDTIEHAAQIAQGVRAAMTALDASSLDEAGDEPSACQLVTQAIHALESIGIARISDEPVQQLKQLRAQMLDVTFSLGHYVDTEEEGADLDQLNARIHELTELVSRWGPTLQDVIAWRDQAELNVQDLDASPEKLAELQDLRQRRYRRLQQVARKLTVSRQTAADRLGETVTKELAQLAMSGARLDIRVEERTADGDGVPFDATGGDTVSFMFTPFPSAQPMPMGKSASGGELSRLMLALELALAERVCEDPSQNSQAGMTFIFDEVDAGVGGKTAVELGRRLARLAQSAQVLIVTHLPQVASWADAHYVVAKQVGAKATATTVRQVSGEERVEEIARMLAGNESHASLDHARELLAMSSLDHVA